MSKTTTYVAESAEDLISYLSKYVLEIADASIEKHGLFTMGVSGGSIIKMLAEVLEKATDINWAKWTVFFCDERLVKFTDADSTYGQFKEKIIDKTGSFSSWFPIDPDLPPAACASDYEKQLKVIFRNTDFPKFDILLLGMGPDGHTCSLFPEHLLLLEDEKWVAEITDSPKPPSCRVTLTLPVINNARNVAFVCTGASKAPILKEIFGETVKGKKFPAGMVKPTSGDLTWMLDKAAADKS